MAGVEYGNGKVVTYSQSRNRSSSSCGSSLVVILLSDFIQLQITSNGNKTANIYVHSINHNLKIHTSPLHNVRRTLLTV